MVGVGVALEIGMVRKGRALLEAVPREGIVIFDGRRYVMDIWEASACSFLVIIEGILSEGVHGYGICYWSHYIFTKSIVYSISSHF